MLSKSPRGIIFFVCREQAICKQLPLSQDTGLKISYHFAEMSQSLAIRYSPHGIHFVTRYYLSFSTVASLLHCLLLILKIPNVSTARLSKVEGPAFKLHPMIILLPRVVLRQFLVNVSFQCCFHCFCCHMWREIPGFNGTSEQELDRYRITAPWLCEGVISWLCEGVLS